MSIAYAVMFCLAFTAAVLLAPLVRMLAVRIGAVDRPDGKRKIHARPTPRLGGVVITAALICAGGFYFLMSPGVTHFVFAEAGKIFALASGFVIVLALGIWDDIKPVKPRTKIAFQTLAVVICFAGGVRVDVPFSLGPVVDPVLSFAFTWFWFVACINSMNLVDGMDGLAGGVVFFAGAVILVVAAVYGKVAVALGAAALLGSVVGFLMYNFHPAVMFLGDSGSLLLGYVVAVLALAGSIKSHATVALLVPILALGLPIMDTLLAILRRMSRRLPISQADREHIHHRLLAMGLTSRQAVLVLYSACLALAAGALVLVSADSMVIGLVLALLCVGAVLGVQLVGVRELESLLKAFGQKLRGGWHAPLPVDQAACVGLAAADDYAKVAEAIEPFLASLGAAGATVRTDGPAGVVLLRARVANAAESSVYNEYQIALPQGVKVRLVVEGGAGAGLRLPDVLTAALAGALSKIGKQGIRGTSVGASGVDGFSEGPAPRREAVSR